LITEVAMNAIRAAKLPVSGRRAAAPGPGLAAGPPRRDAQVIALADYRAQPCPAPGAQRRPAPGAQRRPGAPAPLRLTRRGRIAAAAAAALLAGGLSLAAAAAAQAAGHAVAPGLGAPGRALTRVTVRPGDSLWSLAERADPGADPRLVIQQIIRLNRLGGDTVLAGERLWAPRG
jgi:nucleoid-associated protein YgaU